MLIVKLFRGDLVPVYKKPPEKGGKPGVLKV